MTSRRANIHAAGPAIAAAVLGLALYAVTLGGTYVYDDVPIIAKDPRVHSPDQWKLLWTEQYFTGGIDNLYRPLVSQSFALQWWLHGDRAWAFHLVNLLLHAAVCAMTAELARRLAGLRVAYIAGLLFAAHPIHVEAVAEIVGRADELCTLLILAALALFLGRPLTNGRAVAIGLCGVGAMLAKEQGMLTPFLLLALGGCTRFKPASTRERQALQTLVLMLSWPLAGLIVLREEVLGLKFEYPKNFLDVSLQPLIRSGPVNHVLMVFVLIGHYAQLMIAPVKLSFDYGMSVLTSAADRRDPYLYAGILTAIALAALLAGALKRRQWAAAFCLIAAGITYSMVSNVFLIGTIFGERLMYLPSCFLLIWASIYLARLPTVPLAAIVVVLVALGGVRTVSYAMRWNDRYEFYVASLREQPRSVRLHEALAMEMLDRGDVSGAWRVADEGTRVAPDYWNIWFLAGKVAEQRGDLARADALYHHAFSLQPVAPLQIKMKQLEARMKMGG